MTSEIIGYLRDLVAAVIGVLILFGVDVSDDQLAGILLLVATAGAFGSYLYTRYKQGDGTPAGTSSVPAPAKTSAPTTVRKPRGK